VVTQTILSPSEMWFIPHVDIDKLNSFQADLQKVRFLEAVYVQRIKLIDLFIFNFIQSKSYRP